MTAEEGKIFFQGRKQIFSNGDKVRKKDDWLYFLHKRKGSAVEKIHILFIDKTLTMR